VLAKLLKYRKTGYQYSWSEIFIVLAIFTKELGSSNDFGVDIDYLGYPFYVLYFLINITRIIRENAAPKALFLYLIASSIISIVSLNLPPDGFIKQIVPIIVIVTVSFTVLTKSNIRQIFLLYVDITLLTAIFGIIQVILSFNGVLVLIKEPGRLDSIAYEPSHYAAILMPALVYTYINIKDYFISFMIMLAALLLTFNLTCYIVFLGVFTFATFNPIYVLITVPLAYYLSFYVLPNFSSNFYHRFYDTYSTISGERNVFGAETYINTTTLSLYSNFEVAQYTLAKNPFTGSGLGGHEEMYFRRFDNTAFKYNFNYGVNAKSAHSLSIRILSELGLVGSAMYLYLLIKSLWTIRKGAYYAISLACISHFICKTFKLGGYIDYGTPFFFTVLVLNARAFRISNLLKSKRESPTENSRVSLQQAT
jgi:hypothetical protein